MSRRLNLGADDEPFLHSTVRAVAVLALATTIAAQRPPTSRPQRLDSYLMKGAQLTSAQRTQLLAGHPVTRMLDTDRSQEVAVLGAV